MEPQELWLFSPNAVRVFRSRRMRWAGHVARMEGGGTIFFRVSQAASRHDTKRIANVCLCI